MSEIHPTAIISDGAVIGEGTTIGPYSVVGPKVVIGRGNRIGSHVVIEGHTKLGNENTIFQFASIGAIPQDLKYAGEDSILEVGNKNLIREYVTLQPGTKGGGMITKIGDGNLFMACGHVGHDGIVGNNNIFANSAALAGHVTVGNYVTVGGLVGIHQFVKVGDHSLIGAGSMVTKDIPPFCLAHGNHVLLVGLNVIGLERRGFKSDEIASLKRLYRELFRPEKKLGALRDRVSNARKEFGSVPVACQLLDFIDESKRGIAFPRSTRNEGENDEK